MPRWCAVPSSELGLGATLMTPLRAHPVVIALAALALIICVLPPALLPAADKKADAGKNADDLAAANKLLLSGKYAEAAEAFAKLNLP